MAELKVEGTDVVVRLRGIEALAACRREVRLPVRYLTMVHVEQSPMSCVSLLRLPGIAWPGAFAFGSRRRGGCHEFVAVRSGVPAVVLEAEGALWDRVVVSQRDAVDIAAELAGLLLWRGPGSRGHGGHGNGNGGRRRRTGQPGANGEPSGLPSSGPASAPGAGRSQDQRPGQRRRQGLSAALAQNGAPTRGRPAPEPALKGESLFRSGRTAVRSAATERFWVQDALLDVGAPRRFHAKRAQKLRLHPDPGSIRPSDAALSDCSSRGPRRRRRQCSTCGGCHRPPRAAVRAPAPCGRGRRRAGPAHPRAPRAPVTGSWPAFPAGPPAGQQKNRSACL